MVDNGFIISLLGLPGAAFLQRSSCLFHFILYHLLTSIDLMKELSFDNLMLPYTRLDRSVRRKSLSLC